MKFPHLTLVLICGCVGIDSGESLPDAGSHQPDDLDLEIMQIATRYHSLSQINNVAYTSALTGVGEINLYVWGDSRDYKTIAPETTGSNVDMLVGTVIVREVIDAQGNPTKLTLMAKAPSGYDASLGDWWFGVLDPSGSPLSVDGQLQIGRLTDCHSCHIPRASDDYLFGVPQSNRHH